MKTLFKITLVPNDRRGGGEDLWKWQDLDFVPHVGVQIEDYGLPSECEVKAVTYNLENQYVSVSLGLWPVLPDLIPTQVKSLQASGWAPPSEDLLPPG